jgi:hypothetical protein
MIDMSLVASALSSLNACKTLLSSAIELRDEAKQLAAFNGSAHSLAEAYGKLLAMQVAAAESNAQCELIAREKRDLEDKLVQLEREKNDFERYALHELAPGVFVYKLSPAEQPTEPAHYLCTSCRSDGKKSILARVEDGRRVSHDCPYCKTAYIERRKTIQLRSAGPNWVRDGY